MKRLQGTLAIMLLIVIMLTFVSAISPPQAQAAALLPVMCEFMIESPWISTYVTACLMQLAYDGYDPTGDPWLVLQ